jgi:hypothetical protein
MVIYSVRSDTVKLFARVEVVTTGKGLLDRVAFVVARARNTERYPVPNGHWLDL